MDSVSRPRFYADATALIGLARINRLPLLGILQSPIFVTASVWAEVVGDPTKPEVDVLRQAQVEGLLRVVDEGDVAAFPGLDSGESSVISAAAAAGAAVIVDERKARALIAGNPELRGRITLVTGIIGLVLLAKRRGYVQSVRPILDDLILRRFYISPSLYRDVLKQAGEAP